MLNASTFVFVMVSRVLSKQRGPALKILANETLDLRMIAADQKVRSRRAGMSFYLACAVFISGVRVPELLNLTGKVPECSVELAVTFVNVAQIKFSRGNVAGSNVSRNNAEKAWRPPLKGDIDKGFDTTQKSDVSVLTQKLDHHHRTETDGVNHLGRRAGEGFEMPGPAVRQ
jgi:hypothetical protein